MNQQNKQYGYQQTCARIFITAFFMTKMTNRRTECSIFIERNITRSTQELLLIIFICNNIAEFHRNKLHERSQIKIK